VTAALFLEAFVPPGIAWAHFDTFAWNPQTRPGRPKGGEAMGLRAAFATLQMRYRAKESHR
jgi:leucyl aminopeptidase